MKHLKLFEEFATLGNTPGMGDATPPTASSVGSGDTWGSITKKRKKKKVTKTFEHQDHEDDLIWDFAEKNWEKGWNMCKAHGLTKGQSKEGFKKNRPGHVAMWLRDLYKAKKLSTEEKTAIGLETTNEDKKHYNQSALRLKPEEKEALLKLIPDAEFEIDDEGEAEDVRQLVWSDTHDEAAIRKAIQTVTKHP